MYLALGGGVSRLGDVGVSRLGDVGVSRRGGVWVYLGWVACGCI